MGSISAVLLVVSLQTGLRAPTVSRSCQCHTYTETHLIHEAHNTKPNFEILTDLPSIRYCSDDGLLDYLAPVWSAWAIYPFASSETSAHLVAGTAEMLAVPLYSVMLLFVWSHIVPPAAPQTQHAKQTFNSQSLTPTWQQERQDIWWLALKAVVLLDGLLQQVEVRAIGR